MFVEHAHVHNRIMKNLDAPQKLILLNMNTRKTMAQTFLVYLLCHNRIYTINFFYFTIPNKRHITETCCSRYPGTDLTGVNLIVACIKLLCRASIFTSVTIITGETLNFKHSVVPPLSPRITKCNTRQSLKSRVNFFSQTVR